MKVWLGLGYKGRGGRRRKIRRRKGKRKLLWSGKAGWITQRGDSGSEKPLSIESTGNTNPSPRIQNEDKYRRKKRDQIPPYRDRSRDVGRVKKGFSHSEKSKMKDLSVGNCATLIGPATSPQWEWRYSKLGTIAHVMYSWIDRKTERQRDKGQSWAI